MKRHDIYESPLVGRYASERMSQLFSDDYKYGMWRDLWCNLAEAERWMGLPITGEQIDEMVNHTARVDCIDYDRVAEIERETHHDVIAHLRAFAEQCPLAAPIIHLGATSCFITDNTDAKIIRRAMALVHVQLQRLVDKLSAFAAEFVDTPTLGYTHLQPAQPTTVGKRAAMWIQDLKMDQDALMYQIDHFRVLGCRGATGTCASFMELFHGDYKKVVQLEEIIFDRDALPISGQTYTRKQDFYATQVLSGIAQSATKFANDIRFLAAVGEIEEPFGEKQVGSSAMAYKRNPVMCERITGLARYVITTAQNTALTASAQFLERTLDDSSNRRIVIPEMFLAIDAVLETCINVVEGLKVNKGVIESHLSEQFPFMLTEDILMYCVNERGADRQKVHEALRELSMETVKCMRQGGVNDLLGRIKHDPRIDCDPAVFDRASSIRRLTGAAEQQTRNYLESLQDE